MKLKYMNEEELLHQKEILSKKLNILPREFQYTRMGLIRELEAIDRERLRRAIAKEKANGKEETTKSN